MTISKETGTKLVKVGLAILTPTVILILVLLFLYWRKKKKQKLSEQLRQNKPTDTENPTNKDDEQVDNM